MEKHENTKPSLHTGFVKMNVVAGRDDLKMRTNLWSNKPSDRLDYDAERVRQGQHMLSNFKQDRACVPFGALPGRDSSIIYSASTSTTKNKTMQKPALSMM